MFFNSSILIISIAALLWSANHLVTGASGLAKYFKIPPLFIGLTIVAIGTTAPEIMVSVAAAMAGKTSMALGNAIGSNIANMGLVMAMTAIIQPIPTNSSLIRREFPVLFVIMLLAYILMADEYISRIDGIILLTGCLLLILYFAWLSQRSRTQDIYQQEIEGILTKNSSIGRNIFSLVSGLVVLPVSAHFLVISASNIAIALGISELTVGLSIVALGTSLPELAASVIAAIKHEDDIAIGNILGSNMFNILLVIGLPAVISPAAIKPELILRDIPVMIFLSLMLFVFYFNRKKKIQRLNGAALLLIYVVYITSIFI